MAQITSRPDSGLSVLRSHDSPRCWRWPWCLQSCRPPLTTPHNVPTHPLHPSTKSFPYHARVASIQSFEWALVTPPGHSGTPQVTSTFSHHAIAKAILGQCKRCNWHRPPWRIRGDKASLCLPHITSPQAEVVEKATWALEPSRYFSLYP